MPEQANIWTKLDFDGRGFEAGILRAEKRVTAFGKAVAARLGALFSAAALTQAGRRMFELADKIKTMAQQTGVTAEEFQKMQYIADKTGIKIEDITMSIKGLALARDRAMRGKSGNPDEIAFGLVGISPDQIGAMSASWESFLQVIGGLKNVSGLDRQTVAQKLMSETGIKALPLVNAELEILIDRYKSLGLAISDPNIDKLADFKNDLKELSTFAASTAAPALAELADNLKKVSQSMTGGTASTIGNVLREYLKWYPNIYSAIDKIENLTSGTITGKHAEKINDWLKFFPGINAPAQLFDKLIFGGKTAGQRQYGAAIGPTLPVPGIQYSAPIGPEWPFAAGKDKTTKKLAQSVFSPSTDALARIGGFVGRGAPAVNYAKLQLDVQKKIQRDTKRTADALGPGI